MDLADLYRDIVETSPDGIWVIDLTGRTVYANAEIARMHRVHEDALPELTVRDTLDHAGRARFAAHLLGVREGRVDHHEFEVQWVRSDGDVLWALCREVALLDDEGRPWALVRRYSDNTERHEILASLRDSEDALEDQVAQNMLMQAVATAANQAGSLRDVLVHARSLVLLHDDWERARGFVPQGSGRLEPLYVTEADRDADAGDPRAAQERELAQRARDTRSPVWDEQRLTIAFPVLLGDEVYAVVVLTSALPLWRFEMIESMAERVSEQLARVAERERAQRDLALARDEAMEASRQKSEFLATMSHEIRTPLNGVIGLSDLLLRTPLDTEQRSLASGVQSAGRALLGLVDDVLDFATMDSGRLELRPVDFEIRPLLQSVVAGLSEPARNKGLDLRVTCDPDLPAALCGDAARLAQVVSNLVSNAVKFTECGEVILRASAQPAGDRVRLRVEVSDTGVGVPSDELSRLFDPFTQADSSTTRRHGGTGLGLALSREIAEAMGGTIEYSANPAGGSVFACTVLLDEATGGSDADEAHRRGRILVVEDNPVNQVVATGFLNALGYTTATADDGLAAIEAARHGEFDAILMDVQMPHLDGYTATGHIRAEEAGRRCPIIAMTAAALEGERERCLAAGMDDYLTKPVDPARLADTLRRWLDPDPPIADRLDLRRLAELRELDDPDDGTSYVDRAIENLTHNAERDMAAMRTAAAEGDATMLRSSAHRLAGSALNLGAVSLGEGARSVEELVVNGAFDEAVAGLPALGKEMAADLAALRAYQREQFPARARQLSV
jgi:PAS domain S-box-containing protein